MWRGRVNWSPIVYYAVRVQLFAKVSGSLPTRLQEVRKGSAGSSFRSLVRHIPAMPKTTALRATRVGVPCWPPVERLRRSCVCFIPSRGGAASNSGGSARVMTRHRWAAEKAAIRLSLLFVAARTSCSDDGSGCQGAFVVLAGRGNDHDVAVSRRAPTTAVEALAILPYVGRRQPIPRSSPWRATGRRE